MGYIVDLFNDIVQEVEDERNKGLFLQIMQQLQNKMLPARNDLKWNNNYKDIKTNFIEKFKDYGLRIKEVIRAYKINNQKISDIMKEISETLLIKFDKKRKVDSEKFRAMQYEEWDTIKQKLLEKRDKIKNLIIDNFETLKTVSDSFEKISKHKEDAKDEMTKRIREEWPNYIKNIDSDLLSALSASMQRSMEELEKAVCGDRSKKEPKVFLKISNLWKPDEMKITFQPNVASVKKDLEGVMNEVTNFQEHVLQLSHDALLCFEERSQKKFQKNESINHSLNRVLCKISDEVDRVSRKFIFYVNELREDKINISFKDKYNKFKFSSKDSTTEAKKEMLRQEKYQDLLGYENQIETIHKDFGEIDPTYKIHFIEVNNSELKKKLLNEVLEIRGNVKGLIRNKFMSHIQGIVNLLQGIKDEFKESVEYTTNTQDRSVLEKFKFKRKRLGELRTQKNDYSELYDNYH